MAMSSLSRNFIRKYVTDMSFVPHYNKRSSEKTLNFWKKMTYFVAFPVLTIGAICVGLAEKEHFDHPHRDPYIPYEHLYILTKPFPWGDGKHTLFHNPRFNAVPGVGYEKDL